MIRQELNPETCRLDTKQCRYVYTGPGGASSVATDPPGTPVAPCIKIRIRKGEDKGRKREKFYIYLDVTHTHARLHTDAFAHKRFYTQTLLHTNAFTHRRVYTQFLAIEPHFVRKGLRDECTHRRFYTQMLLHTLDKNGSLYDPAGTESCNMQIRLVT